MRCSGNGLNRQLQFVDVVLHVGRAAHRLNTITEVVGARGVEVVAPSPYFETNQTSG